MGNHFVMSMRFNKCTAADFGLVSISRDMAMNPYDGSTWNRCELYDFGWGKENGFYKSPMPDFDALIEIALNATNNEDVYGAVAIILERHPDQLLYRCEKLIKEHYDETEFQKIADLFNLKLPINRSSVLGKTYEQIKEDHARWQALSEMATES